MLTRTWTAVVAALALALVAVTLAVGGSGAGATSTLDPEEQAFFGLINDYRAQNGLGPLSIDPSLQDAAEWMSADLGANNYFSHTDSLGRGAFVRMCSFGYCYSTSKGE